MAFCAISFFTCDIEAAALPKFRLPARLRFVTNGMCSRRTVSECFGSSGQSKETENMIKVIVRKEYNATLKECVAHICGFVQYFGFLRAKRSSNC